MNINLNNNDFYEIYGLKLKSHIPIHNKLLIKDSNKIDAYVTLGKTNSFFNTNNHDCGIFKFSKDRAYFNINNIASYEILNGSKIIIEPAENSNLEEIKKYLIGSALGILLFQRDNLAIHGSSIVINNKVFIFSGDIGAGKTTLVSSLINKGYGFLSDDISSISNFINNKYYVYHSFPHQKLCEKTAEYFGYKIESLYKIDKVKNKYYSPYIKTFCNSPKELKSIIYLQSIDCDNASHHEVFGVDKFKLILSNIFRKEILPNYLISPLFVKKCLTLSSKIKVYKIIRPKYKDSINELIDIVEYLALKD
ncbi:MAG: hypothetical protein RSD47_08810 [Romboutsia sp.]